MQLVGQQPSWRIAVAAPMELNFALFVRDSTQLQPQGDFPPALPRPVPGQAEQLPAEQQAAAESAWSSWWGMLVDRDQRRATGQEQRNPPQLDPPGFGMLADRPGLRRACQVAWRPFRQWWSPGGGIGPKRRLVEASGIDIGELVHELERQRGLRARPFDLSIAVVEAGGHYARRYSATYLLVTGDFWKDVAAVRPWLREAIGALL
jgi:hypothetical protein